MQDRAEIPSSKWATGGEVERRVSDVYVDLMTMQASLTRLGRIVEKMDSRLDRLERRLDRFVSAGQT